MESNVVEIAPPVASCSTTRTPNKAVTPEVIDVEQYEVHNGGAIDGNHVDNKNKGKAIEFDDLSYDEEDEYVAGSPNDAYGYPGSSPISNSLLDPDSLIYEDDYDYPDQYGDQYGYEMEEETDNYSMYQDLFDSKDIPTGVEVSMDWFPNSTDKESAKSGGSSKSSRAKNGKKSDGTSSSSKKKATGNGIQSQFSFPEMPTPLAQPWNALPHNSGGLIPSNAYALPQNSKAFHYASAPPFTNLATPKPNFFNYLQPQTPDTVMGEAPAPFPAPAPAQASSALLLPNAPGVKAYAARHRVEEVILPPDSSRVKRNMEDYLGKYLFFKRFDIVEDSSGHHYASQGTTSKQHSKDWAKRIQEEWKILEHDLPEMIFVRAYESRMDLLRAVIIGAQETPYHDGLFFFDIFFPDTYPSVPPTVHYHSGGLRINPNLYNCGKVCLSLLGTWSGNQREKWIPNKSTMLQVLVSIQGLILNQKPYFNEPGYERTAGSVTGEKSSKAYSENTLLLSLKTMVYTMRRPPKYFEDFVYGHFFSCAHDVLKACNAYRNGASPGVVVKGAQDVEESSESSSVTFRTGVATFVDTVLVKEFILLGVLGLEEEGEDKAPVTNNVAESSNSTRSSSKRDRVSSS